MKQHKQIKKIMKTLSEEYPDYVFMFAHKDETITDLINKGIILKTVEVRE